MTYYVKNDSCKTHAHTSTRAYNSYKLHCESKNKIYSTHVDNFVKY